MGNSMLSADNTYECAVCHGVFEKGITDEEAMAESEELFGHYDEEDLGIVCDDCWKRVMEVLSHA